MTTYRTATTVMLIFAIIAVAFFIMTLEKPQSVFGGSFTGTATTLNYATTTTVGPQGATVVKTQIFARNPECDSRVISTPGTSAIMISFNDIPKTAGNIGSTTVSASAGHLQAASTTVNYDSAVYGCGTWNAWAWASTSITISEFQ